METPQYETDYKLQAKDILLGAQMLFVALGALVLVPLLTVLEEGLAVVGGDEDGGAVGEPFRFQRAQQAPELVVDPRHGAVVEAAHAREILVLEGLHPALCHREEQRRRAALLAGLRRHRGKRDPP